VPAHDYDKAGKPVCAWDDEVARDALVTALVTDALAIIDALPVVGLDEEAERAVALLALVAGQDVEPGEKPGQWRIARAVAKDRVVSTVDPESRHAHTSRSSYRDGYKGHISAEPETGLVTATTLTGANTADGEVATELLADEPTPVEVLADSAYGGGQTRTDLIEAGHTTVIKPLGLVPPVPGGLDRDDFTIDYEAATVTCPNNHTVTISKKGNATFGRLCDGCPLRPQCTTSKSGRSLHTGRARPAVGCCPGAGQDPTVRPDLSASVAGRTLPRLDRQERASTLPLPRGHTQPVVVELACGGGQPVPAAGPGPAPRGWLEGARNHLNRPAKPHISDQEGPDQALPGATETPPPAQECLIPPLQPRPPPAQPPSPAPLRPSGRPQAYPRSHFFSRILVCALCVESTEWTSHMSSQGNP
jgi:hypothetical protein